MTCRLLLCVLVLFVGCAGPEPERSGEGEAIFEDPQEFEAPPPLKPTAVENKTEAPKPAWKKPPQSVLDQQPTARAEVEEAKTSARDVDKALDESEAERETAQKRRRLRRQAETRKQATAARKQRDEEQATHAQRVSLARQACEKSHASWVEDYLAEAERRAKGRGREVVVDEAYRLRERALRTADVARARAEDARHEAENQERLALASLDQGVHVPGSEAEVRRARERWERLDLEAVQAEGYGKAAAEAHRRLLLGKE